MNKYTKSEIEEIVNDENYFESIFSELTPKEQLSFLRSIGKIKSSFSNYDMITATYKDSEEKLRYEIIRTLSKMADSNLLNFYKSAIKSEPVSETKKRNCICYRQVKKRKTIPLLTELIGDNDPNVTLQAIRGLLVFKDDQKIIKLLKGLKNNPNEIVKMVIENELFTSDNNKSNNHKKLNQKLKNKIVKGDSLHVLKKIEDDTFHLTFTYPYYNTRLFNI